jgi:hypothetical protein
MMPQVQQAAPAAWQPNLPAPPQLQLHQPFAQAQPQHQPQPVAPQPVQYAPQHAPMPVHTHAQMAPVQYAAPAVAPQYAPVAPAPQPQYAQQVAHAQQVVDVQEPVRRTSRAPKGMGSSLRLDDPSLRDTIRRARDERAGLAEEYRKLTAPLVDTDGHAAAAQHQAQVHAAQQQPQQPVLVGHDPNGVPLFATPGVPGVHPIAQYPAPARVPAEHGMMPRPAVQAPLGAADPAYSATGAFQRRAPYAPQAPGAPAPEHAHA